MRRLGWDTYLCVPNYLNESESTGGDVDPRGLEKAQRFPLATTLATRIGFVEPMVSAPSTRLPRGSGDSRVEI